MTCASHHRPSAHDPALVAWERRRRAAWFDYLRTIRSTAAAQYEQVESDAWRKLERRLRRNDERLSEHDGRVPAAHR